MKLMEKKIIDYKKSLKLSPIASEFFEFVSNYLSLHNLNEIEYIKHAYEPWFGKSSDRIRENDFTQYLDGRMHQKYKIALEFCAVQAGLKDILCYVESDNILRPKSYNRFWFHGTHPNDIKWVLFKDKNDYRNIITYGLETPGSINIDTINHWLKSTLDKFKRVADEQTE
jgi:hypothetical protein